MNSSLDRAQIQELGTSLRQIDRNLTTSDKPSDKKRVWYQGGELYFDVFVDLRGREVDWFQFTLRGRSLSWSRQENPGKFNESPWQTGQTHELEIKDTFFHPASTIMTSDRAFNYPLLAIAYEILATRPEDPILCKVADICRFFLNREKDKGEGIE